MAIEFKRIARDWWKPGLLAGGISILLSWLIAWLKIPLVNVTFSAIDVNVRDQVQQGISTDLGAKILGLFSGLTKITLPAILGMLLGYVLVVYLGRIIYTYVPKSKTPVGRMSLVLLLGSLAASIIAIMAFKLPAVGTLLAMGLYFVIISLVMWLLSMQFNLFRIPE